MADATPAAAADDRRDVRRRAGLDGRDQRLDTARTGARRRTPLALAYGGSRSPRYVPLAAPVGLTSARRITVREGVRYANICSYGTGHDRGRAELCRQGSYSRSGGIVPGVTRTDGRRTAVAFSTDHRKAPAAVNPLDAYKAELATVLRRFGANVRRARVSKEPPCSQAQLSYATRLHRTEIGRIEQGAVEPRLTTLMILADALDVSVDELLRGLAPPQQRRPAAGGARLR